MMKRYEFQLCAAIHTHSLLWTSKSINTLIAEDFICADIPDPIQEPQLYQLVIQHQIYWYQRDLCDLRIYDSFHCAKGLISQKKHTNDHMNSDTHIDSSKKKIDSLFPMHHNSYYSGELISICNIVQVEV